MDQAAETIADRYQLVLTDSWARWFNCVTANPSFPLPGAFNAPVLPEHLVQNQPRDIWPGFMLPDTLPVLGNQYGDWICVRFGEDNRLNELIHWYHGGGDWIPVGSTIEEAVLHDIVDQFRPARQQMLRGAAESLSPGHLDSVASRLSDSQLREWLVNGLPGDTDQNATALESIFENLQAGQHKTALEQLMDQSWSYEAAACDLLEIATREHNTPEFKKQADSTIRLLCKDIIDRRSDLSWPFEVLGRQHENAEDYGAAAEAYYAGRFASTFTSQAVRLGNHSFDRRHGKFSVSRLAHLLHQEATECVHTTDPTLKDDGYVHAILNLDSRGIFEAIRIYWTSLANSFTATKDHASAYQATYAAGWDIGNDQLEVYNQLFSQLSSEAIALGWVSRAELIATHSRCLEERLGRRRRSR